MNNKLLEIEEKVKNGYFDDNELIDLILYLERENQALLEENQKYKEVIDKAIEYIEINKRKDEFLELNEWGTRDLLEILKEVE